MAGSNGLVTSGLRWGLSCTVKDEAQMGLLLGYMKIFGADDIGFAPLGPVAKGKRRKKDPAAVARGIASAKARKRGTTAGRKPLRQAAEDFVRGLSKSEFRTEEYQKAMAKAGWKGASSTQRALTHLKTAKLIRVKGRGVYAKLPALVKAAG